MGEPCGRALWDETRFCCYFKNIRYIALQQQTTRGTRVAASGHNVNKSKLRKIAKYSNEFALIEDRMERNNRQGRQMPLNTGNTSHTHPHTLGSQQTLQLPL